MDQPAISRSWTFLGGPGSWPYHLFDAVRRRVNRRLVSYLARQALDKPGALVLESGSGTAYAAALLATHPNVRASVAVDIDPEPLTLARRRRSRPCVVVADAHRLPFRSGVFDLVWSSSTLEHLDDPRAAVSEMRRVARDGGAVFAGVPYRRGPLGFQPWIRSSRLGVWIGPVFGRAQLVELMTEQGLAVAATTTYFLRCFVGALGRKAPSR